MITTFAAALTCAKTLLYVPGTRPDRFGKATRSGADGVVLDLEDSVADDAKVDARNNVKRWFGSGGGGIVRINPSGTPWHDGDLEMVRQAGCSVILPKVAGADQVVSARRALCSDALVVPLLESAIAVLHAQAICAVPGVVRVIFGSADFARDIGVDRTSIEALKPARSQIVLASAACGIAAPIDGASTDISSEAELRTEAEHVVALGFGGKSCIHPRQLPIVRAAFTPSREDIGWAFRVISRAPTDGSITSVNGELIGKPVVERARQILRASGIDIASAARCRDDHAEASPRR